MQYYVYLLFSEKDKGLYIGETSNLKKRLQQHLAGEVVSTHHRRPLRLLYYECFRDKRDAKSRERYLKSGYGRIQLKDILKNSLDSSRYN